MGYLCHNYYIAYITKFVFFFPITIFPKTLVLLLPLVDTHIVIS